VAKDAHKKVATWWGGVLFPITAVDVCTLHEGSGDGIELAVVTSREADLSNMVVSYIFLFWRIWPGEVYPGQKSDVVGIWTHIYSTTQSSVQYWCQAIGMWNTECESETKKHEIYHNTEGAKKVVHGGVCAFREASS